MLRIQRAVLLELLLIFTLIVSVVTAIVFGGFSIRFVTDGGTALGSQLMAALLPKLIPVALAYSAPFAWLAAVALVLGRWVSDHEVTALKAAGIHVRAIALPVLAMGAVLAVCGMLYNANGVAASHREVRSSVKDFLPQFLHSLKGADRSIAFSTGRLSWLRFDPETNEFVGAELDKRDRHGRVVQTALIWRLKLQHVLKAEDGESLLFLLRGAYIWAAPGGRSEMKETSSDGLVVGHVERIAASSGLGEFLGARRFLYRPKDMVLRELLYVVAREGVQRGSRMDAKIALHGRLSLGCACFFLGLFAAAMALFLPPSSRRVRDFMACFGPAILLFFPLLLAGPSLAKAGTLPAWLAMWSANLVLLLAGSLLLVLGARR